MALPIKPLPVIERWDCHQCGACCRGSIVPRDNVTYVTLRRACPSAAADKGRTVGEQMEMARALVRERYSADAAPLPPAIKPGEFRGWRVARTLLQTFERLLTDERYPPVRRLVHALA